MLNAFRHQRFNTNRFSLFFSWRRWCSTPFGIRDSTPEGFEYFKNSDRRAQRLSASEIQHGIPFKVIPKEFACSTPFGIRDSTQISAVLGLVTGCSAQRLSASEIQHISIKGLSLSSLMCSTPFGIRDSTRIGLAGFVVSILAVLNAFRHQRFNTVEGRSVS